MTPSHRHDDGESGVTLILVSLVLVGLMAMAALVVDIGGAYNARRLDQSGADAGSLAAAFALPDRALAITEGKQYAEDTLDFDFTDEEWDSCEDLAVPSGYTQFPGSNCIAFNGSGRRALVRIPERPLATTFARVIGVNAMDHSAFAIAGVTPVGFGGVLPFGLVGNATSFMCAESGGGNTNECRSSGSGTSPGNFGVTDFAWWGDDISGTTTSCSTTGQAPADRLPNNVALGSDHDHEILGTNPRKLDTGSETFPCPGTSPSNAAPTVPGENLGDEIGAGMWSGGTFSDGLGPRLQRLGALGNTPSWMTGSDRTTNVDGHELDDIPLWEFIPESFVTGASVPRSCHRDQFTGADNTLGTSDDRDRLPSAVRTAVAGATVGNRVVVLLDRCFTHYMGTPWAGAPGLGVTIGAADPPCHQQVSNGDGTYSPCAVPVLTEFTDPVFSRNTNVDEPLDLYDIQYTPRFAFVPKTTAPGGNQIRDIVDFYTVYIQRVLGGCSHGGGCNLSFDPGTGYSLPSPHPNVNGGTDAIGVMVFPHSAILPNGLAEADAAFRNNASRTRALVR